MRKHRLLVIAGHSGSGKSTLARAIASEIGCEQLGFSYAGEALSASAKDSEAFASLEEYIHSCIESSLHRSGQVVLDGLASERIYEQLLDDGFAVNVIYLDTPKALRIERIAEREGCSLEEAAKIEATKARGKSKAGLEYVIGKAEFTIDGSQALEEKLDQALRYYESLG
ncbi:MAG: AAA family ATPase [bacterium]|nr:AAA family ATPase [bacterium]